MKPPFEWNPEKAKANLQKHQVDFEEASTVFDDPQFITFLDEEHSADEERYTESGHNISTGSITNCAFAQLAPSD